VYIQISTADLDPMWTVSPYDKHAGCREVAMMKHSGVKWQLEHHVLLSALVDTFDKNIDSKCME